MRSLRPLLAAAALGVIALGTTGANAAAGPSTPPIPQPGQSNVDYLCNDLFPFLGVEASCDDIECGPRSCGEIQGDRAR